jgi:hypothetical protein
MNILRRAVALVALFVALLTAPMGAWAQRDLVGPMPAGGVTVPALPSDHVTERRGPLSISFPRAMRPVVETALARAERDARAVATQLGVTELPPMSVRLVADAAMMRRLAPQELPPPAYAVGVAYPMVRLVLVSATAPQTFEASNMAQVLRHELSHLLFAEASGHRPLPRWLAEGIAVHQSDENTFERFQELATASWSGRLLPLAHLDEGFAEGPTEVSVAYAQSADFTGYLLRKEGAARFAVMLGHVRDGSTLDEAVRETWGSDLLRIEEDWRHDVGDRMAFAPLWAGTGVFSLLGVLLVGVALVRRRRRNRQVVDRWEREERVARTARWTLLGRPPLRLVPRPQDEPPTLH